MKDNRKDNFLKAFKAGHGIILTACEAVGISRSLYYKWMKEDPDFKEKVDAIQESQIDFVESKLIKAIEGNDTTAIIFYLKTKGKKRGYNEKALPPKDDKPQAADQTLPAPPNDEDTKKIAARVKNKKTYITKLLKKQGKYTAELTYQVDITAQLLVRADILGEEILSDSHKTVNVEYSREGNERMTIDPKEKLYLDVLERGQKALRALGMNTESKDRKSDNDSLAVFMGQVGREREEEDE